MLLQIKRFTCESLGDHKNDRIRHILLRNLLDFRFSPSRAWLMTLFRRISTVGVRCRCLHRLWPFVSGYFNLRQRAWNGLRVGHAWNVDIVRFCIVARWKHDRNGARDERYQSLGAYMIRSLLNYVDQSLRKNMKAIFSVKVKHHVIKLLNIILGFFFLRHERFGGRMGITCIEAE